MYGIKCLLWPPGKQIFFIHTRDMLGVGPLWLTFTLDKVFIFLSIARFILGVGVGGVYPLAATVAAEGSSSQCPGQVSDKAVVNGFVIIQQYYNIIIHPLGIFPQIALAIGVLTSNRRGGGHQLWRGSRWVPLLGAMVGCHSRVPLLGATVLRCTFLYIDNTQIGLCYLGSMLV